MSAQNDSVKNGQAKKEKKAMVADVAVMQAKILDFINSGKRSSSMIHNYRRVCQLMLEDRLDAPNAMVSRVPEGKQRTSAEELQQILSQKISDLKHLPGGRSLPGKSVARYVGELLPFLEFPEIVQSKRNDGKARALITFIQALGLPLESTLAGSWIPPYLNTPEWSAGLNRPLLEFEELPPVPDWVEARLRGHRMGQHFVGDLMRDFKPNSRTYYGTYFEAVKGAGLWSMMRTDGWVRPTINVEDIPACKKRLDDMQAVLDRRDARNKAIAAGDLHYQIYQVLSWPAGADRDFDRKGLRTLNDLVRKTRAELLHDAQSLDAQGLDHLEKQLNAFGLRFGMTEDEIQQLGKKADYVN